MDSVPASPKRPAEEKKTFLQIVSDFIRANRVALLAILLGIIVVLVSILVFTSVRGAIIQSSTSRIEQLEDDAAVYESEQDQAKKAELEKALIAGLDETAAKWPKLYAGQKAHALKAKLLAAKKDWTGAEAEWLAAVNARHSSYLAPIALQEAAVAAEERGSPETAKSLYERFLKDYPAAVAGIPHAHFALGRLAEDAKDYVSAIANYEKIVASYPDSDWTKLAKDRILFIKSRGLAK
jgi:tetratricopeptide (TPR) repeat protein